MHFIPQAIIDHAVALRVNGLSNDEIGTNLTNEQVPAHLVPLVLEALDKAAVEPSSSTRPASVLLIVVFLAIGCGVTVSIVVGQTVVDAGFVRAGAIGGVLPGLLAGGVVYFAGVAILRALGIPIKRRYSDPSLHVNTPLDKAAVDTRGRWMMDDGGMVTHEAVRSEIAARGERLISDEPDEITVVARLDEVADFVRKQYRLANGALTEVLTGPIANADRLPEERVTDEDVVRVAKEHSDAAAVRMYRLIHDVGTAAAEAAVQDLVAASE
jgi:hypothetical protein